MNTVLKTVFDSNVVANIAAFVPVDEFEIDTLFGFTHIAGVKHYITYGGGPEGGYVYFASQSLRVFGPKSGPESHLGSSGTATGSKKRFIQRLLMDRLLSLYMQMDPRKSRSYQTSGKPKLISKH